MARKFLTPIDLTKQELQNARLQNLSSDPSSPVVGQTYFNTVSNKIRTYNGSTWDEYGTGAGSGSVTSVSVVSANGLAGTVATSSTTPAITLSTSVTGVLKGNGTAISAASAGTDYLAPNGSGSALTGITESQITNLTTDLAAKAPTASPSLTGTPTAPTASAGTNTTQIATTAFVAAAVAAVAQGLDVKNSAVAATTGSETYTVTSGSVTQINGTAIDGVSPAVGDRILIKDAPSASGVGSVNSTQPGNGLYTVTSNTTNLSVSRATDQSGTNNPQGDFVFVEGGTANGANGYVVTVPNTTGSFTYGTNNIKWSQFSGAGQITAGTGLTKSGNTLAVATNTAHTYTQLIGDGSSTSIAVTHNLGNQWLNSDAYDGSTSYKVDCDVVLTSSTVTTFIFAPAPATNAVRVVLAG